LGSRRGTHIPATFDIWDRTWPARSAGLGRCFLIDLRQLYLLSWNCHRCQRDLDRICKSPCWLI
jgi:hypothetical protein